MACKVSFLTSDNPTTSGISHPSEPVSSDKSKCRKPEKKASIKSASRDQYEELQIAVLTAELSRITAEKRKIETEEEVLTLKKRKLELELELATMSTPS